MNNFKVILEDLEIKMYLGIHDFEKINPQRVLICAEMDFEAMSVGKSDIFDYDRVVDFIRSFSLTSIETQEELVKSIHDFVMSLGAISAKIYSRKPDVYGDCKSIGISYQG
jgi:dihydroneopterin aldolase